MGEIIMKTIAWLVAVLIAVLLAGCSSLPQRPPTAYQRYVAAVARVGLHPTEGKAAVIVAAKRACADLASDAENDPGATNLVYAETVTELAGGKFSEAQAAAILRAAIDDFCPQWKVLLRQQG
jgi:non-ribosomal peptide synthetase component F